MGIRRARYFDQSEPDKSTIHSQRGTRTRPRTILRYRHGNSLERTGVATTGTQVELSGVPGAAISCSRRPRTCKSPSRPPTRTPRLRHKARPDCARQFGDLQPLASTRGSPDANRRLAVRRCGESFGSCCRRWPMVRQGRLMIAALSGPRPQPCAQVRPQAAAWYQWTRQRPCGQEHGPWRCRPCDTCRSDLLGVC
jgi:hypothetical protein